MPSCPACADEAPDDAAYCPFCGFYLTPMRGRSIGSDDALPVPLEAVSKAPESETESLDKTVMSPKTREALARTDEVRTPPPAPNRSYRRFPIRVHVDLHSQHNFYSARTENISCGGLFIATAVPSKVGELLTVEFTIPGLGMPVEARCEVRWSRRYDPLRPDVPAGMGLKFVDLSSAALDAIEAFIRHRKPLVVD